MATTMRGRSLRDKLLLGVAALALWQLLATQMPFWMFPGLVELASATRSAIVDPQFEPYLDNIYATFKRLAAGFVLSVLVGGTLGTLMGLRNDVEAFFRSWVILGLSLPAIAVAFALVIAIGISEWVPVLTVTIVGVPFVMLNMWEGTQDLDRDIGQMADFYGVGRYQRIRDVLLPQLLQYLFPSMYWGLVVSWKVLFIAEVFGAGSGVGYMVSYWFQQQRVDMLLGWVLIPVILIIVAQETLQYAEQHVMAWR